MRRAGRSWPALALSLAGLLAAPALAEPPPPDDEWSFSFAPYLWLLALDGDMDVNGNSVDVDLPFHDILEDLSFAFMGTFEAHRGRWFGGVDGMVSQLDSDAEVGPTDVDADVDAWLTKVDLFAGYRLLSHPLGPDGGPRRLIVDAFGGGRLWYVDTDVKLRFPILGDRRLSSDVWWVDPLVGLRVRGDVTDRVALALVGDVGGFDIGSASEFSWQARALLHYRLGDRWTLAGGYRAIGLDRSRSGDGLDATFHGPVLGAVYTWGAGPR